MPTKYLPKKLVRSIVWSCPAKYLPTGFPIETGKSKIIDMSKQ